MFSILVISIGRENRNQRDAKLGGGSSNGVSVTGPQRIPAFSEEAPPEPPLFGCASACSNLYHIRIGLGDSER